MFGERLRGLMSERGLTVTALARKLGMSRAVVYAWLDGQYGPQWDTVVHLAEVLEVSTEVFRYAVELPAIPEAKKRGRPRKDQTNG